MRGLAGDLSTMPLKDLAVYLGNKRASGTLQLERGAVRKTVLLVDGQVVNASSNQPREYLGQFLINMGHLTEEQFMKAYQTQAETKIFLGKILTMIGLVNEDVVATALALKLRETLLEAFNWAEGNFEFDAVKPELALQGLDVTVDLLDIHREGEFRETAWQAIRGAFPHGNLQLEVVEKNLPEKPKPGSLDEKIVAQIQEGHTIDDMVLALHATDFFLYQRLYALYRLDAVRVAEDRGPTGPPLEVDFDLGDAHAVVGEEQSDAEIARHAESFLDDGNAKDAAVLARRAFELNPSPPNAELLRRAELALNQQLKADMMGRKRVPSLLVPPAKLKGMQLTSAEKYLLSRVDSTRDLQAIIQVSPLQELEALKLFQRFVDDGLVRLSP